MKKSFLSLLFYFFLTTTLWAQLPNGSTAPDFTVTDINGQTHHLYDYLNQGKYVVLEFSATWCGPCWNFHQGGQLDATYEQYGPNGTNELVVLNIEIDPNTSLNALNGIGSGTQGDWVTGTSYPINNPNNAIIPNLYEIPGTPTLYGICPNRRTERLYTSQITPTFLRNRAIACPAPVAGNNPALRAALTNDEDFCEALPLSVYVQNYGTSPLTSANIAVSQNGTTLLTYNWTGNLATYNAALVDLGSVNLTTTSTLQISITSANASTTDDVVTHTFTPAIHTTNQITVNITSDSWVDNDNTHFWIEDANGNIVAGTAVNSIPPLQTLTYNFILPNTQGCYRFVIAEDYGDGMTYNSGAISVLDSEGSIIFSNNNFGAMGSNMFQVVPPALLVKAKVYLQGPYNSLLQNMTTELRNTPIFLPSLQPFATWGYSGTESVNMATASLNITDWVLVELRDANNMSQVVSRRAALLYNDGTIHDTDGSEGISFANISAANYYIVVKPRGHLAVMSASSIPLPNTQAYDFTLSASRAYGSNQQAQLSDTTFGCYAGDANHDGIINLQDFNQYKGQANASNYNVADFNQDRIVSETDFSYWQPNAKIIAPTVVR